MAPDTETPVPAPELVMMFASETVPPIDADTVVVPALATETPVPKPEIVFLVSVAYVVPTCGVSPNTAPSSLTTIPAPAAAR